MLLIDSGNSALKTRLLETSGSEDRVFSLHQGKGFSAFADYLSTLSLQRVYSASVASRQVQQSLHSELRRLQPSAEHIQLHTLPSLNGVTNAYRDHRQMGVDRWLALMAASSLTQHDAIIIDAGSAITIDLLSAENGHLGGAILPGFNTGVERFREIFPSIDFADPQIQETTKPGTSTVGCIDLSDMPVTANSVRRVVEKWSSLLKRPIDILVCGQDAPSICENLDYPNRLIPDLVFIGMLKQIQLLG